VLAWITIFNLVPVWQLDGARAFRAFSSLARGLVLAITGLAWLGTQEGLLALLGLMTLMMLNTDTAPKTDRTTWLSYVAVLIAAILLTHVTPGLHIKN
jgi:Zn-dependent protease